MVSQMSSGECDSHFDSAACNVISSIGAAVEEAFHFLQLEQPGEAATDALGQIERHLEKVRMLQPEERKSLWTKVRDLNGVSLVNLAVQCPDPQIRLLFQKYLLPPLREGSDVLDHLLQLGPSSRWDEKNAATPIQQLILTPSGDDGSGVELCHSASILYITRSPIPSSLRSLFVNLGELSNYYRIVAEIHPDLLSAHHDTMQFLLFGMGTLSPPERFLAAMIGAAQHDNLYLFRRFATMYFALGNQDPAPFTSLPPRLSSLRTFAGLAAHRPWLVTADVVRKLIREEGWEISEFMHAAAILSTVHCMSGFVSASGLRLDASSAIVPEGSAPYKAEDSKRFAISQFSDGTRYAQRIVKSASHGSGSVNIANYNWNDHGSILMERYYDGAAPLISCETEFCESLCDTIGESIDVRIVGKKESLTAAAWWWTLRLYVMNVYGVIYDEFNNDDVNTILSLEAKRFIHRVVCTPEDTVPSDVFWAGSTSLTDSHRLLIAFMAAEARRMAELILICHAVHNFLGNS